MLYYDESKLEEAIKETLAWDKDYSKGLPLDEIHNWISDEELLEGGLFTNVIRRCFNNNIPPENKKSFLKELDGRENFYLRFANKTITVYKFGDAGYSYWIGSTGTVYHEIYYREHWCYQIAIEMFLDCQELIDETQELINKIKPHLSEYTIGMYKIYERRRIQEKKKAAELNARFTT